MTKKESTTAFLRRVTGLEDIEEAKQALEGALVNARSQLVALQNMGTLTIIVVPGGAFGFCSGSRNEGGCPGAFW